MNAARDPLSDLRREIDDIDNRLHDLLMRRAGLVARIRDAKHEGATAAYRPGREAQVLRRLAARHRGPMPLGAVVRIWRELMGAFTGMQETFVVALWEDDGETCRDLARDHFGALAPLSVHPTARGVIRAVSDGEATVGVLPVPRNDEANPWWPVIAGGGEGGVHICARLPFAAGGNGRGVTDGALIVARMDPEPSGDDHTYLAIRCDEPISRARLLGALETAGLFGSLIAWWAEPGGGTREEFLVEINDFVAARDRRLAALTEQNEAIDAARVVGAYAVALPDGAGQGP